MSKQRKKRKEIRQFFAIKFKHEISFKAWLLILLFLKQKGMAHKLKCFFL